MAAIRRVFGGGKPEVPRGPVWRFAPRGRAGLDGPINPYPDEPQDPYPPPPGPNPAPDRATRGVSILRGAAGRDPNDWWHDIRDAPLPPRPTTQVTRGGRAGYAGAPGPTDVPIPPRPSDRVVGFAERLDCGAVELLGAINRK